MASDGLDEVIVGRPGAVTTLFDLPGELLRAIFEPIFLDDQHSLALFDNPAHGDSELRYCLSRDAVNASLISRRAYYIGQDIIRSRKLAAAALMQNYRDRGSDGPLHIPSGFRVNELAFFCARDPAVEFLDSLEQPTIPEPVRSSLSAVNLPHRFFEENTVSDYPREYTPDFTPKDCLVNWIDRNSKLRGLKTVTLDLTNCQHGQDNYDLAAIDHFESALRILWREEYSHLTLRVFVEKGRFWNRKDLLRNGLGPGSSLIFDGMYYVAEYMADVPHDWILLFDHAYRCVGNKEIGEQNGKLSSSVTAVDVISRERLSEDELAEAVELESTEAITTYFYNFNNPPRPEDRFKVVKDFW